MAMTWDNVEAIRNAQASAKERFEATALATTNEIQKALESETAKKLTLPRITEIEQMIFKLRAELIDYIVAHGLVDGMIWNGELQPTQNGKIVITADMIDAVVKFIGYFQESDVQAFLEKYLPANHYVSDADYVHTDNNFTDEAVTKLAGIENGAEVNKVIDVLFNGKTVLDDGTRVATITITPEDIKKWYEENPNTNTFTDVEKTKLAGIADGADVNRVDDVIVNRQSVMNDQKQAIISKELIRDTYEANDGIVRFDTAKDFKLNQAALQVEVNTKDIAAVSRELNDAKNSVSELGDEVNTVAGRVTTIESKDMTYLTRITFDPRNKITADMKGAGIFEFVFTAKFLIGLDVTKLIDVVFVGPAVINVDGATITIKTADMDCVSGALTDETGTLAKFGTFSRNPAGGGVSMWIRSNGVRLEETTIKSVTKISSLASESETMTLDEADLLSAEITLNGAMTFDYADYDFDSGTFAKSVGETKNFSNEKITLTMHRSSSVTFTGTLYLYNLGSYSISMPVLVTYYYKSGKIVFDGEYSRGVTQMYGDAVRNAAINVLSFSKI